MERCLTGNALALAAVARRPSRGAFAAVSARARAALLLLLFLAAVGVANVQRRVAAVPPAVLAWEDLRERCAESCFDCAVDPATREYTYPRPDAADPAALDNWRVCSETVGADPPDGLEPICMPVGGAVATLRCIAPGAASRRLLHTSYTARLAVCLAVLSAWQLVVHTLLWLGDAWPVRGAWVLFAASTVASACLWFELDSLVMAVTAAIIFALAVEPGAVAIVYFVWIRRCGARADPIPDHEYMIVRNLGLDADDPDADDDW